jgi:hypothetical protein
VYVQKTQHEQDVATIIEGGQKDLTDQMDPGYPMLAWSTTGYKMAVLYKKNDKMQLRIYNSLKGRIENYVIPAKRFDRVLSMAFMQDDDKMVFSAIKNSQTDLYEFTIKGSKLTNITNDVWDDVDPVFVSGGSRTGILFLSNRPKPNMNVELGVNELPTGPMNVFFYNTKTMRKELVQCTNITKGHITQPIQYGLDNFAYLYDTSGINNKYVVLFVRDRHNIDSAYSVPITNYNSSIISQQYNLASGDVADVVQVKDKYRVYFHELQMPGVNATVKQPVPTFLSYEKPEPKPVAADRRLPQQQQQAPDNSTTDAEQEPGRPLIQGGTAFQSEFTDTATQFKHKAKKKGNNIYNHKDPAADSSLLSQITDSDYVKMKPANYRLSFKPDFFSIKLDNSVLFSQYQSIAANGGSYVNPSLGALATLSLNELMENHRITAGFQLPINTSGSTYFIQYQNFTRRLDWGLLFLRNVDKQTLTIPFVQLDELFKTVSNQAQADFSYPLDRVRSVRFHSSLRQDKLV